MQEALDGDATRFLAEQGVLLDAATVDQLQTYLQLLHDWNPIAGLVSRGDAESGLAAHIVDSLSLVAAVTQADRGLHLDIGSGGGLPAIPLAILLPQVSFLLLERGMRKCGFLTKAAAVLGLENITVQQGAFPELDHPGEALTLTARAVERPASLHKTIAAWMQPGDHFLNQSGLYEAFPAETFHVEHAQDPWTHSELRRGELHLITRRRP